MTSGVAKLELENLTDFQNEIHLKDPHNEGDNFASTFNFEFCKLAWFALIDEKLKCEVDGNEARYTVNNTFHFLIATYMRQAFPAIRVKPEKRGTVQICWPHNLGTNIINNALFKIDHDIYQSFDDVWCDIYFQFYMAGKSGMRENHNISIGNIKCLEKWTSYLPAYVTNVDQPWFYSNNAALAFPIFYCSSHTTITHNYTLRRKISELLRMRIKQSNGTYKELSTPDFRHLEGVDESSFLRQPELWGKYSYNTKFELDWFRCKTERVFYFKDIARCDDTNPRSYNEVADVSLHSDTPCLSMFWVALNVDAKMKNNYSNYTTDISDCYIGWDPITSSSLKYGNTSRFENMPSDHFNLAVSRRHFPSCPCEPGYHAYSLAYDSTSLDAEVGIVFAGLKARLLTKLEDNKLLLGTNDSEDDENDLSGDYESSKNLDNKAKFLICVRMLVLRKFVIEFDKDKNEHQFKLYTPFA